MTDTKTGDVVAIIPKQQETGIVPQQTQQMAPLAELSVYEAQQRMALYQEFVNGLLTETDYQKIQGKDFKKKSAWRKLAMAMNISVHITGERREELPNGDYAYHFDCEARHPNGRVMPGSGSCTAFEKATWKDGKWQSEKSIFSAGKFVRKEWQQAEPNSVHNVRSTAETRASNRCVSNLVAAGEVSADEADQGDKNGQQNNPIPAPATNTNHPTTQQVSHAATSVVGIGPDKMNCPQCGSKMWDNRYVNDGGKGRYHKNKDTQPDWKCSDKTCGNSIWLDKYSLDYQADQEYAEPQS